MLANARAVVSDLMDENVISVGTLDDIAVVADMFAKYDLTVMPVVDGENRLVGIVTVDDAIDVMRDEATEDIEKMAAITPSDKPYPRLSVTDLYKSRIPWLLLLMLSAVFTQLIIGKFEAALAANIILTSFIPMLMDTGGNSGSQSSVTIIRSLSLAEIRFSDIFRIMFKEMRVALLCGATLAVVNFGKLMLFDRLGFCFADGESDTLGNGRCCKVFRLHAALACEKSDSIPLSWQVRLLQQLLMRLRCLFILQSLLQCSAFEQNKKYVDFV